MEIIYIFNAKIFLHINIYYFMITYYVIYIQFIFFILYQFYKCLRMLVFVKLI